MYIYVKWIMPSLVQTMTESLTGPMLNCYWFPVDLNGIFIYSFMWENDFEINAREISATLLRLQCAMKYFWGQPSEWYPFGPCRITNKMMLNSMHCHHIVGLEISAKALMPLSQIPPECARSCCMPFHTSRSTLSCNMCKQTNKQTYKQKQCCHWSK